MTSEQMLTAIIERAEKNGFDFLVWYYGNEVHEVVKHRYITIEELRQEAIRIEAKLDGKLLLIDHDFCKALWGEYRHQQGTTVYYPGWKEFLQRAVISDNMLQYVYDTIKE